uniref:Protein Z-dependent protease inhibitor n=1 Tax=Callorhinchus milii TaxID=7868 RepID=V9KM89_CALMI
MKLKMRLLFLLISGVFMMSAVADRRRFQRPPGERANPKPKQFPQQRDSFHLQDFEYREEASMVPPTEQSIIDTETIHMFTEKNTEFGFNLFRKIANLHEDNVFISPITVSSVFAMLSLGAEQDTYNEILKGINLQDLGRNTQQDLLHILFQWLWNNMTQNHEVPLSQGSDLFVQDNLELKPTFLNRSRHFYNVKVTPVNFQQTSLTKDIINQHIYNKTNGKIHRFLESVDSDSKLMLINYILFKGSWVAPFNPNFTEDGTFYVNTYIKVNVPMMFKEDYFLVTHDKTHSCTILKLPYKGSVSMLILVPKDAEYLLLEDELRAELIEKWIEDLHPRKMELYFPKFKLDKSYKIAKKFRQLGITTPFMNTANFSGISSTEQLKISQVFHRAVIEVNERGTEAAAVTAVTATAYSLPKILRVEHPFLFIIYEETTKTVLFIGRVKDPTKF